MRSSSSTDPRSSSGPARSSTGLAIRIGLLLILIVAAWFAVGRFVSVETLVAREAEWRGFGERYPVAAMAIAFAIYVIITGASLPGAAPLTLVCAWYFGFARSLLLVSFASTLGATLAFLISRYLIRDQVRSRFGDRLSAFDRAFERDGLQYLFLLRLVPAVPFFLINLGMGLTSIRTRDFWWVSQLGMLPGTIAYCWAGSRLPSLAALRDDGLSAIVSPQLLVAFGLLGVLPLILKRVAQRLKPRSIDSNEVSLEQPESHRR